jgi:hypothetical protein
MPALLEKKYESVITFSLFKFTHQDGAIVPPKAKSIAQGNAHRTGLGLVKSKIQIGIKCRIVGKVVDGRGH